MKDYIIEHSSLYKIVIYNKKTPFIKESFNYNDYISSFKERDVVYKFLINLYYFRHKEIIDKVTTRINNIDRI